MNVKRLIWVLTAALMLCLLAGGALAEEIHKVDIDRVYYDVTPGVVIQKTGTDGNVVLTVDVENTDWEMVAACGGIDMSLYIDAPDALPNGDPITGHYSVSFGDAPQSVMLNQLHHEMKYDYATAEWTVYSNGQGVGAVNGDLLRPESSISKALICWGQPRLPNDPENPDLERNWYRNPDFFDIENPAAADARYYEELTLQVRFSQNDLIYMEIKNAPEEWLEPNIDFYAGPNSFVERIDLQHPGQMDIYLKERSVIEALLQQDSGSMGYEPVQLRFKAPQGAERLHILGYGEYPIPDSGIIEFVSNNTELVKSSISSDTVRSAWHNLLWTKDGELVDYGKLQINVIPADHDLCAFYEDTMTHKPDRHDDSTWISVPMQAVPSSRMIVSNQAANCGVTVEQKDGYIKYGHDGTVQASGDPGYVTVSVTPPDAKYRFFRFGGAGGSDVFGHAQERLQGMFEDAYIQDYQQTDGSPIEVLRTAPLTTYQAGPLKVYLQQWTPERWMNAGVTMILWYETEEQAYTRQAPGLVEFICEEEEEFHVPIRVNLVNHEHHITKPVENVTLIKPLGKDWHDWKLNVKITPQKGTNAWHYELHLESDTGVLRSVKVSKDDPLVIYMPYPEGYSMASENAFEVYHFEHQKESDDPSEWKFLPLEVLKADNTPFGLRFEVTSLSPFVLSAAETEPMPPQPTADPQSAPPATGDSSALLFWSVLAVLSLAGMIAVSLRKREA